MASKNVTNATFDEEVLANTVPVIVDFWAPWCGPCHAVAPVLDRIVSEREGTFELAKVNIDDEPELAVRFGVASIPTIILFADGKPVAGTVGVRNKGQLEKALGLPPIPGSDRPEPEPRPGLLARLAERL